MRVRTFALAAIATILLVLAAAHARADEDMDRPGYGMRQGMMGMGYGPGHGMRHGPGYGMGYGMYPDMMGMGYGSCYDLGCSTGMGCGHGPSWDEYLKFFDKSRKLRKELHMKMFEYNEALRDPETKDSDLGKMIREIRTLREKIEDLYTEMLMPEREGTNK